MVDGTGDEVAIRRILDDQRQALHDRDAESLLAHLAPDVLVYDLAPPLNSRGAEAEAEKLRDWFATWKGPIDYQVHELGIEVGAAVAYSTGLARLRGTKVDGSAVDLWLRSTIGYRRIDGQWRIAHAHESVPFRMDGSERAALDLRP
jgi:ketosteroid isomerase-like protein